MLGMGRGRLVCALLLSSMGGCSFDTSGPGGSPASGVADDTAEDPSAPSDSEGSTDATNADEDSDGGSDTNVDPDTSTTESGGDATGVVIVGGPLFDFSNVDIDVPVLREIEVRNLGEQAAQGMSATLHGEWFAFEGGEYPGVAGTCGDTLAPDERCIVVVSCIADGWGTGEGGLTVSHVDAALGPMSVSADFVGNGKGVTKNLVVNGGGEDQGSPPPSWEQDADHGTDWHTTTASPAAGAGAITAGFGGGVQMLEVRQTIDVQDWAPYVDASAVTIRVEATLRTDFDDDDPVSVRLLLRDGDDELARFETDWHRSTKWTSRSAEMVAPVGTRSIVVVLRCNRETGDTCNGYFDDVRVTGRI